MTNPKSIVVVFGATGDLSTRKLIPSLYRLFRKEKLSEEFAVVGVARRPLSNEQFRATVKKSVESAFTKGLKDERFLSHFYYQPFDVTNKESYQQLKQLLDILHEQYNTEGNQIFYMAMSPEFFDTISLNLKTEGLASTTGFSRLVIEKPFGHDLESAEELNDHIRQAFDEKQIYRIDHYLGKEMVQNIEVIRFANAFFEPLWNNRYIANIQITSSETLGVEDRGVYYDQSGALKDVVQNHILQMVALLAMEPPIKLLPEDIRQEKVKALRSIRLIPEEEVSQYFVRGQYTNGKINTSKVSSYLEEPHIAENSMTETYVAGKILVDNFRWAGVPFYIRAGKRMKTKSTRIVVQFKDVPMNLYYSRNEIAPPNLLVVHIQPNEGVTLHLNVKKSGSLSKTVPIQLDYSSSIEEDTINTPEAYERLLYDCMLGDSTNFTHWQEVAASWAFIDPIKSAWQTKDIPLTYYKAGSMGPKEADKLLKKDGFHWWDV